MKRAIGVAALGGGLLALGAGAAGAQEASADASARVGRPTSAEVRVCANGRVLSGLLGSCAGQAGGTGASVQAGRTSDRSGEVRARVRAPRVASADLSVGTRRARPRVATSGQAAVTPRSRAATAEADTTPRARATVDPTGAGEGRLLRLRPLTSLAGVGLLGSSPFTLVGDPAAGSLLPTGPPTLDLLGGEAPAGIGVLGSGPIASGDQAAVDVGDVSPAAPVTVCGNGVGVLGDASAGCGTSQQGAPAGSTGSGSSGDGSLLADPGSGSTVEAGIGGVSPSAPLMVCGNGVGALGDASVGCGPNTSTGGTTAPPPGTTPRTPPGQTGGVGTPGTPGSTGSTGLTGLAAGTGGRRGGPVTDFAPLRPFGSGSDGLPFTGAASDLLAAAAAGLVAAGALFLRAARPAAAKERR